MSAKDEKLEADVEDEALRHAVTRAKTLKDDADARLESVEATQFERGYN
jgi:hypothetical protein